MRVADAEQRDAEEVVEVDGGPDDLEHVRQERDACAGVARGLEQLERHRVGERVRADDEPVRAGAGDDLEQRLRLAGDRGRVVGHRLVDRDAVEELGGKVVALEDRAQAVVGALVADEQAALARQALLGETPREAPAEHRADDEHDAEHDRLVLAGGAADERHVGEPDAEHEQRAELGQARELLDRGLADALVVALVEAEDLGRRDDGREQQQRPAAHVIGRGEPDGDGERDRERDHVGERQRAAQAPLAEVAFDIEALGDRRPRRHCWLDKRWPLEGWYAGRPMPLRRGSLWRPFLGSGLVHKCASLESAGDDAAVPSSVRRDARPASS